MCLHCSALNIAQYQNIVFGEYFAQWHATPLPEYTGYNPDETPGIDMYVEMFCTTQILLTIFCLVCVAHSVVRSIEL